jgi:hypothetical protein
VLVSDPDGKNMRIFASGLRNAVFRGYQVAFVPFRDGRPSGEATPFFSDLYRNLSEFSISRVTFPVTVTTNQPVAFTVIFTPGATGAASAAASFASNASSAPTWSTLTGTGTPAAAYTVGLN